VPGQVARVRRVGIGMALAGDGSLAVVGVPGDDRTSGSVRGFVRVGTTWSAGGELRASDGEGNDKFGASVACSADGSIVVVGVPVDGTSAGANAGTVRVFRRASGTWVEGATLVAVGTPFPRGIR